MNYHLTPVRGRWKLSSDRSNVIFAGFGTRSEALQFCDDLLRNKPVRLQIHHPDGRVQEERSYPVPEAA